MVKTCAAVGCHNNKKKNKDKTFFSLPKDPNLAKEWIAKIKRKEGNLPKNVCICSDHFEEDCFDLSWKVQSSSSAYTDRPIQRVLITGSIPTKFPHNPASMKERPSSLQREERRKRDEVKEKT